MARRKLLFLITEDWFFRSHFMPLLERALEEGYDAIVAGRMGDAEAQLIASGARTIDLQDARSAYGPIAMARSITRLSSMLRQERPDIVHAIALRPILLSLLAAPQSIPLALAVTGRGYLATARSWREQRVLDVARTMIAGRVRSRRAVLLVENDYDRAWVAGSGSLPETQIVHMPGAGVELERYAAAPEPDAPPIRVGMVARLIRSKGGDVAVDAVRRLREEGLDIELSIAGAQDFDNPAAVTAAELASWKATPGIHLLGRVEDVPGFWAGQHIACLPSRGGEGLPRSLLEASACGRPVVSTRVPGCADFVREGETGLLVEPDDVAGLVAALRSLAQDGETRRRLGAAGRAHVAAAYTTKHAADCAAAAWRKLANG